VTTTTTPIKKGTTPPDDWQARFLVSLAEYGNVTAAAKAARISRDHAYTQRAADEDFAAAWDAALQRGTAGLEDEARRRAFKGVRREEAVYYQGAPVGKKVITEYSDTLLIFLLKAHDPKFRETTRNVNINLSPEEAAKMTDDEIEQLGKERGLW
jgi:hypothetical protein